MQAPVWPFPAGSLVHGQTSQYGRQLVRSGLDGFCQRHLLDANYTPGDGVECEFADDLSSLGQILIQLDR